MDVSIVIPVHNGGELLERAIKSALAQHGPEFEVILVNDGPSASTGEWTGNIGDARLKFLSLPQRLGVSAARNAGIQAASGTCVAFLDADDIMLVDMVAKLHECMIRHNADIAVCGYMLDVRRDLSDMRITDELPSSERYVPISGREEVCERSEFAALVAKLLDGDLFHPVVNKLYRKELLETVRFDELVLSGLEDELLNIGVFKHAKRIAVIPDILYETDLSGEKIVSREYDDNKYLNTVKLWRHYESFLADFPCPRDCRVPFQRQLLLHYLAIITNLHDAVGFAAPSDVMRYCEDILRNPMFRDVVEHLGVKRSFLAASFRFLSDQVLPGLLRTSFPSILHPRDYMFEQTGFLNDAIAKDMRTVAVREKRLREAFPEERDWVLSRDLLWDPNHA